LKTIEKGVLVFAPTGIQSREEEKYVSTVLVLVTRHGLETINSCAKFIKVVNGETMKEEHLKVQSSEMYLVESGIIRKTVIEGRGMLRFLK
jgi:hypothetical protein